MNTLIDIGINLTNKQFQGETNQIIERAVEGGVTKMILTGTSIKSSQEALKIVKQNPSVLYSTAGIHPHDAKSFNTESIAFLRKLLTEKEVVSVGECGLDFDRDFSPRSVQETCYRAQLELAIETQKPLFLHERAAFDRFLGITKEYLSKLPKVVVHCFTGTLNEVKTYLDNDFYIGFTGAISDSKRFERLREVVRYVPLDKMMIETDAPFMLPKNTPKNVLTKYQERRNEPAFLPYVAATIGLFKGISESEIINIQKNAEIFFGI